MRQLLRIAERVFVILALLTYTGGPLVVILSGGQSEGTSGATPDFALVRLLFQLIYVVTFLLLIPCWKRALYLLVKEKTLLLLIGTILASIGWSVDPHQTINRAVALIGTTLFGVYLASRYSLKQQLHLLGWMFGLAIVLSFLFAVALPHYGIMGGTHAGAWRGIYNHKNVLGAVMTVSTIVFLLLSVELRSNFWCWGGLSLSILLMLLSRATSPLINLMMILPAFVIFRTFRWRYKLRTFFLSLLAVVGFSLITLVLLQAEALAGLFGKDLTFTGRSALWEFVWQMIGKHPWLGYGYGALWADQYSETGFIWRAIGWEAPNSHNGFLELWLGLGLVGVTIFLLQFLTSLARTLRLISQSKTPEYFLPLLFLLFTVLVNLTESTLLDRNSIYWVLYSSIILASTRKPQVQTEAATVSSGLILPTYQAKQAN
jgi:exopolysaccharide production protein ExoQ